jgi:hypothetical protein
MTGILLAVTIAAAGLLGSLLSGLVTDELRARLDRFPHALIRMAARRLPEVQREDWQEEWARELTEILEGTDALPLTRFLRGLDYGVGLALRSGAVARELTDAPRPGALRYALAVLAGLGGLLGCAGWAGFPTSVMWRDSYWGMLAGNVISLASGIGLIALAFWLGALRLARCGGTPRAAAALAIVVCGVFNDVSAGIEWPGSGLSNVYCVLFCTFGIGAVMAGLASLTRRMGGRFLWPCVAVLVVNPAATTAIMMRFPDPAGVLAGAGIQVLSGAALATAAIIGWRKARRHQAGKPEFSHNVRWLDL